MDTRKRDSIWQEVKKFLDSFCPVKFLTEGVLPQFLLAIIHLISATKLKPKNTRVWDTLCLCDLCYFEFLLCRPSIFFFRVNELPPASRYYC
jgi:hypothetical protein